MNHDHCIPAAHIVLYRPKHFSSRSGLYPLVEELGVDCTLHPLFWERYSASSWTVGHLLRRMGCRYFGSEWNGLFPVYDEIRIARASKAAPLVHFLSAEFSSPRGSWLFRGRRILGTFHVSKRRQEQVIGRMPHLAKYHCITLVSETQRPYFLERGVPNNRLHTILHGVDRKWFCPDPDRLHDPNGPLRCLMVGDTERDHSFLAEVMRALPPGTVHLKVRTSGSNQSIYHGIDDVELMPFLDDVALRAAYRSAELFVCPMLDCTANNAVLEAMACGTPVLVNRVGGIPEYVPDDCCYILPTRDVNSWVDRLTSLAEARDALLSNREAVREWTKPFCWKHIAAQFISLYDNVLSNVSFIE